MPRFKDPGDLLTLPIVDADWSYEQANQARFFLTNVETVFRDCRINPNTVRECIRDSKRLLAESGWADLYPERFVWDEFARTQIDRLKDQGPYLFEKACRAVLCIEAAVAEANPTYDIYDHIRIIPAVFVLDNFTIETLDALRKEDAEFDRTLIRHARQRITLDPKDNLLSQLARGYRVSAFVAVKIRDYVKEHHPRIDIGELRYKGIDRGLHGERQAVRGLRVPDTLPLEDIQSERKLIAPALQP